MADETIYICGMGTVTPIGLNAQQTAASVRAGLSRSQESDIYDKHFEPFVLSLLPDEELPDLVDEVKQKVGLTSRQVRLLRLATPAMTQALTGIGDTQSIPLLLGGPEPLPGRAPAISQAFIPDLVKQAGIFIDQSRSEVFPLGRAAGLVALEKAAELIESGAKHVLVGGVDTYLDLYLLGSLDAEDRILGSRVMDGFVPGEGAAFVLIGNNAPNGQAAMAIRGVAQGFEAGHLYSEEPYKGDGLADTVTTLFENLPDGPTIQTVLTGFNGENFNAKEWGVTALRNADRFTDAIRLEHPVDCIGDPGAALGPLLTIMAAIGLQKGYIDGPCLAWCSSDYGTRAAVVIDNS